MRIFALSFALASVLVAAQPAFSASVSRIAAVVNGDMITVRELDKAVVPEYIGQKIDPKTKPELAATVRKGVLDKLIGDKLIMQQAAKDKLSVSDAEVDEAIERTIKESKLSNDVFFKQMEKTGINQKMFREQTKINLLSQKVLARNVLSRVVVTKEEINEFYRANMAGMSSGRARVALIVYPADENAEKWASDIASGKVSFATVARKVSIGPNPQEGGDLGFMDVNDMAPGMMEQVVRMQKGQISPVMPVGANKLQMMLLDRQLADTSETANAVPDAETAQRIEQILKAPRVQERFMQYTTNLRNKAVIDIRK